MAASSPTPYVPFSRRAEWAGLAPIPQPEAPGGVPPVVPIDHPDECRWCWDPVIEATCDDLINTHPMHQTT